MCVLIHFRAFCGKRLMPYPLWPRRNHKGVGIRIGKETDFWKREQNYPGRRLSFSQRGQTHAGRTLGFRSKLSGPVEKKPREWWVREMTVYLIQPLTPALRRGMTYRVNQRNGTPLPVPPPSSFMGVSLLQRAHTVLCSLPCGTRRAASGFPAPLWFEGKSTYCCAVLLVSVAYYSIRMQFWSVRVLLLSFLLKTQFPWIYFHSPCCSGWISEEGMKSFRTKQTPCSFKKIF